MSIVTIIKKTTHKNRPTKVYDFTVEKDHHYILSNGLISHNSYFPTKEMGGGSGLKFAASMIIYLSKKKDKDTDGEVVGNIIHCKLYKGRFTKENKVVDVKLNYETGLDPYFGLLDLAVEHGILTKSAGRIELPGGAKIYEKQIYETPEKYFTKELMDKINQAAAKEFKYGSDVVEEVNE